MVSRSEDVLTVPRDWEEEEGQGTIMVTAVWRVDRNYCQSGGTRVELNAAVGRTWRNIVEGRTAGL